jgi:hypothetical protein
MLEHHSRKPGAPVATTAVIDLTPQTGSFAPPPIGAFAVLDFGHYVL